MVDSMVVVLFSPMQGKVKLQRTSVRNAMITRRAQFRGREYVQKTISDSSGNFYFTPLKKFRFFYKDDVVQVNQEMTIEYRNVIYLAWRTVKVNTHCGGEISVQRRPLRQPIVLECDLAERANRKTFFNFPFRKKLVFGLSRVVG